MQKTEGRGVFSEKLFAWVQGRRKMIGLFFLALYIIFVITFAVCMVIANGGVQGIAHKLNNYPEYSYQQLEQELQNIIVENDGIHPERLSNASIKYDISYQQHSSFEGEYTVKLTDDVTVTAKIGKDFKLKKEGIEREYKTEGEYRIQQYFSTFIGVLGVPLLFILILFLMGYFLLLIISIILEIISKIKANANK